MRLTSISIEGFRGFTRRVDIDLDADVILLHGANGVGKTSLLDAILWVLTGSIHRFGNRGGPMSLYSREGFARVELTLRDGATDIVVLRASDGSNDNLRLTIGGSELDGTVAEERLCYLLLPHLKDRAEALPALSKVLTRGVYLQQDLVRQFIETDSAADRFALLSEVIGAGVVIELQQALEKSRLQWSKSTNASRREQLDPLRSRLVQLDEQLSRLSAEGPITSDGARAASEQLYRDATAILGTNRLGLVDAPTSSSALDRLLKELGAERTRLQRDIEISLSLLDDIKIFDLPDQSAPTRLDDLGTNEKAAAVEVEQIDQDIQAALAELSAERTRQIAAADRAGRAATLAELALEDLGKTCPVCLQPHDLEKTIAHLRGLISTAQTPLATATDSSPALDDLIQHRAKAQQQLERLRIERTNLADQQRAIDNRRALVATRLSDFGMRDVPDPRAELEGRKARAQDQMRSLGELIATGERLSLSVIRLGEQRRREELVTERNALVDKIAALSAEIEALERTHALAGRMIEELRGASLGVTQKQITHVAPIFQRIYSRIDPHPTFRLTQILASMERGKGQLKLGVSDPEQSGGAYDASPILSSSQLNAFAVSLFLALNLALPSLKLNVTMLDDPLQSLDSINLLGLVDVLRRFRAHRQIIVSTHESKLLGLLQRKLRPVRKGERLLSLIFEDWTRDGPRLRTIAVEPSDRQQVLAA